MPDPLNSAGNQPTAQPGDALPEGIHSVGDALTLRQRKRFKTGDLLCGRYKILGELGQGGMGLVFRCLDEVSGIEVAVKMLPPEVSHDTGEMEEVRENFQLVSKLVHQSIATVRTLERDAQSGEYLLVMDCAPGANLRQYRKQKSGKLSLAEALPILRQMAVALDYAHGEKVVHRDIKPSNVMVAGDGRVRVLDFGLAAQIHTSFSRVSQVRYGTSGTGPYMAPEQWEGDEQDASTDQYALGVTAYELLSGRCPFESPDASVLRQAVLNSPPKPIPGLSSSAWTALQCALAKNREERYASCADFVAALGGAEPRSTRKTRKDEGGTRTPLRAVLLIILLALTGTSGWWGWSQWQQRAERKAAQESATRAAAQLDAAQQAQVEQIRQAVESALTRGDLKTAGAQLAELEKIGGSSAVLPFLRQRYESAASASEVRKRYASAKTQYDDAQKLRDGEGFEQRKQVLKEVWLVAERAEQAQSWGEALSGYDAVLNQCRELMALDAARRAAEGQRAAAEAAKQKANSQGAATNARDLFMAADQFLNSAEEAFEKGDFDRASNGWKKAVEQFQSSEKRALAVQSYRTEPLTAPMLKVASGSIRVQVEVPEVAKVHFQGVEKKLRFGSEGWKTVETLPYLTNGVNCGPTEVELTVPGYSIDDTKRVTVSDQATSEVVFTVTPEDLRPTAGLTTPIIEPKHHESIPSKIVVDDTLPGFSTMESGFPSIGSTATNSSEKKKQHRRPIAH